MTSPTNAMEDLDETVMSNTDCMIDHRVAELLASRPNEVYAGHAAWDFHGHVWFDGSQWAEEVWVHRAPRNTFRAGTLHELMEQVNDEYGWS